MCLSFMVFLWICALHCHKESSVILGLHTTLQDGVLSGIMSKCSEHFGRIVVHILHIFKCHDPVLHSL